MEVCSPKDGFVITIMDNVTDGAKVKLGDPLLIMDTDDDSRNKARLLKMNGVRELMAQQYKGAELEMNRRLAELAVEVSAQMARHKKLLLAEKQTQHKLGVATAIVLSEAETASSQASLDLERAQLDLKRFDLAAARHASINELVETYMHQEAEYLQIKIDRLTIHAPISGVVSLKIAKNSFAELGSVLLEIG